MLSYFHEEAAVNIAMKLIVILFLIYYLFAESVCIYAGNSRTPYLCDTLAPQSDFGPADFSGAAVSSDDDGALRRYIRRVESFPRLDREKELALAVRWYETKDSWAGDELAKANLRYVVAIAMKYRRYGISIRELIAEGNAGLVMALQKFEPERNNRFVTYAAYWIRAYILNYVIQSWSLVGGGSGALRSKMFFKLRREKNKLSNFHGDPEVINALLAERFNVSADKMSYMLSRLEARDLSLDIPAHEEPGASTTLMDTLVDPFQISQDEAIGEIFQERRLQRLILKALTTLDERERFIVENRLMAEEEPLALAEIGRQLGVSRERARQLEVRAKGKLTKMLYQLSELDANQWLSERIGQFSA